MEDAFRVFVLDSVRACMNHVDAYLEAIADRAPDRKVNSLRLRAAAALRCILAIARDVRLDDIEKIVSRMSDDFDDTAALNDGVVAVERVCNKAAKLAPIA